jgi:hypothetical protein
VYIYKIKIVGIDGSESTEYVVRKDQETLEDTRVRAVSRMQEIEEGSAVTSVHMTSSLMPGI